MKIITIIGARPQFIKAAALSRHILKRSGIQELVIHTGQHFDDQMSQVFFDQLQIPKPAYRLESGGMSHGAMTGYLLTALEKILIEEQPDAVLVYGDTNSTLAGALAASKLHIPLAHVEAGLRSFNMKMPEEINRILTDRLSAFLFCPTDAALNNLKKEGYESFKTHISQVGDIMYDISLLFQELLPETSPVESPYALCTIHRAENTDDIKVLADLINGLNQIAEQLPIVFPIHPRTKNRLKTGGIVLSDNILLVEPLSYLEFMHHLKYCDCVFTDSGGLQKEAYFAQKNCFVLRNETEWVELIDHGTHQLVGTSASAIVQAFKGLEQMNSDFNPEFYGSGSTSKQIVDVLLEHLGR